MSTTPHQFDGKTALVSGGSQGIGRGVALELAKRHCQLIILVGRNETRLQEVKATGEKISEGHTQIDYVIADLSLLANVKMAMQEIVEKLDGRTIDFVVQTQGTAPNGVYKPTAEGRDEHFAVQVLSRYAISYYLLHPQTISPATPSLKVLTDDARVQFVCFPGGPSSGEIDIDDLDLGKRALKGQYGRGLRDMPLVGKNGGVMLDSTVLEINDRYPSISASHIFTGALATNVHANSELPWFVSQLTHSLFRLFEWLGIINTVEAFAEQLADMIASGEASKGVWKTPSQKMGLGPWECVKENRITVYKALEKIIL